MKRIPGLLVLDGAGRRGMNGKTLLPVIVTAFSITWGSAIADDSSPSIAPSLERTQADHANNPYGAAPARTEKGTPLIGDFDKRAMTPKQENETG
jgi:hypothetical protein